MALALNLKAEGKEAVDRFDFEVMSISLRKAAKDFYSKALELFHEKEGEHSESCILLEENEMSPALLFSLLLSNRSCCNLNLFLWEEALFDANYCVQLRPDWVKGHVRRGDSMFGLRMFLFALGSYEDAQRCSKDESIVWKITKCRIYLTSEDEGLELHQLLPGRDYCLEKDMSMIFAPINTTIWHRVAIPLRNFIYFIVNKQSREAIVVDACWDINGILSYAKNMNIKIVASFISHYHTDHIGGIPQAPFDKYPIRVEVKFPIFIVGNCQIITKVASYQGIHTSR
jgi:hypothetical protein